MKNLLMKKINKLSTKNVLFTSMILLFLQGCATESSLVNKSIINYWKLSGKIGITYSNNRCNRDNCPPKSIQGGIVWQQTNNQYTIRFTDPFGRKVMEVQGDNQQLLAMAPGQSSVQLKTDKFLALLLKKSGSNQDFSQLSPTDLRYWVTGRGTPGVAIKQNGDTFVQKGFTVSAGQWRQTDIGYMPSLITVKKEGFSLRLVIHQWSRVANQS
ncbi:MAG: lipoprotein insertase outer membrane protein LolB [Ostreibacterium sp.]